MSGEREYIAVIDDEIDLVELFSEALKLNGYLVRGFDNPLLALEHLHLHHSQFSLALIDIRMPDMNGFQVARSIYELDKKIKIVCMSAFDTFDSEINRSRMDEFLAKPLHISHLIEVIKKHLELIQYN
jgi:DNA-binding NtrC family response regulator